MRRRRQAADLTLEQLAEKAGLSPHYLSTVETERRDPSLSTITSIAKALACPPGELLGGVRDLSAAGHEAGRLFDGAPAEVQDGVLRILRAVGRRRR